MKVSRNITLAFLRIIILNFVVGFFEQCDQTFYLEANQIIRISSPNYPTSRYPYGSNCRYYIKAPINYQIELSCRINMDKPGPTCYSDVLYVVIDGERSLRNAKGFCGFTSVQETSLFNEMVLAYASISDSNSGYFTCSLRSLKQRDCDCGYSINSKIVGGAETSINEFISMVALFNQFSKEVFCGASIIHYRYFLSAGHCFQRNTEASQVFGLVGDHDISTNTDTPYSAIYGILSIIIHGGYDTVAQDNDIALLMTIQDIQFNRGVGPACLPFGFSSENFLDFKLVTVAGFGTTTFGGISSNRLRKASLNVISNIQCSAVQSFINPNKFCTYSPNVDSCQEDSGGSLYYYQNGRQYTIGIVSFGVACGLGRPSVNTRLYPYLNWIVSYVGNDFCYK